MRDVDRYRRIVGEVMLSDGRSLNRELVSAGLAWWYQRYARQDDDLRQREEQAKAERRGLWRDAEPIAPWEWRRARRSSPNSSF